MNEILRGIQFHQNEIRLKITAFYLHVGCKRLIYELSIYEISRFEIVQKLFHELKINLTTKLNGI